MERLYPGVINRVGSTLSIVGARLAKAQVAIRIVPVSPTAFVVKVPVILRLAVGLVGCLTAFCVLAVVYGRAASFSNPIARLGVGRCGGVPCFNGAIPGETTWARATADFALVQHSQIFEYQIFIPVGADGRATLYPSRDGRMVELVYLTVPSNPVLTVGDIVNQYGPPCVLALPTDSSSAGLTYLTLYYPHLTVIGVNSFAPDTPVKYIVLDDPAGLLKMPADSCPVLSQGYLEADTTRSWHGFASITHYLGTR